MERTRQGQRDQELSTVERIPDCGIIFPSLRRNARKATADFPPVAPPGVTFRVVAAKGPLGMYWSERRLSSPLTGTHLVHLHSGRRRTPTEAPPLMEAAATTWSSSLALTPGSGLRPQERASVREIQTPRQNKQPVGKYFRSELKQKNPKTYQHNTKGPHSIITTVFPMVKTF